MIQTSNTESFAPRHAAKLGPNHGYRIEGDIARLHAEVAVESGFDPRHAQWALQLWACETPFQGGSLSGVKVAEATLPLPGSPEPRRMDAEALARLPAGQRDYSMVLVLASGAPGAFDQIHDFANYPARERFVAPHLEGSAGYQVDGEEVVLRVDGVRNPRSTGNLSGSLALELWALPDAYAGTDSFTGIPLACADLGRLAGESTFQSFERRVQFNAPTAGTWNVVLMLREWAPGGYVTRDFCTFARPYEVREAAATPEPNAVEAEPESVAVEPEPQPVAVKAEPEPVAAKAEPEPIVRWKPDYERDVNATTPGGVRTPVELDEGRVSIMTARVEELAALKGLTRKTAQEIVKGRPYTSLDELVRVRGIGPKLLVKLRPLITL